MAGASEAEVDALVCPAQSYPLNTCDERAKHHDRLVARGFAANAEGDTKRAAELFEEAHALVRTRASTLLSLLNMRLKLGQCELAAAGYLRLMESFELAPRELSQRGVQRRGNTVAQMEAVDAEAREEAILLR